MSEFNFQYTYDTNMNGILRVISPKLEDLKGRLCFLETVNAEFGRQRRLIRSSSQITQTTVNTFGPLWSMTFKGKI
jgi:hypothetical protein